MYFVDYVEPATYAPFHIESDDLKMIGNTERLAVSCCSFTVILPTCSSYGRPM